MKLNFISSIKRRFEDKAVTLLNWQEKSFYFVFLAICLISLPALINSSIRAINEAAWISFGVYNLGYLICLGVTFFKKIPFKIRAWIGIIVFFSIATVNTFAVGPAGSGRVWLFTSAIFATLILGINPGVLILFAQLIVLIIFQIMLNRNLGEWSNFEQYTPQIWTTTSITLMFLSIVSVVAMGRLIKGLSFSLEQSRKKSSQLEKATEQLIQRIEDHNGTIASLKESEERWHFALEGAGDGVWDWDVTEKKIHFSIRWKEMLGFKKDEIGDDIKEWINRIHPEDKEEVIQFVNSNFEHDQVVYKFQYRIRCKDNSYRWMLDRGKVMRWSADGKPLRVIGTHADITVLKEFQKQQTEYEARLEQAQKMEAIGTLAGGIAHDFNNILGAIIGYAELSKMDAGEKVKISNHLNKILIAGNRAKELVQQILTFSRQTKQEVKPIKVKFIFKEVLKLMRASLPSTIEIQEDITSESLIIGDPTQIHQVIMNLCTNASYAMKKNGGILSVSLVNEKLDSDFVIDYPDLSAGDYIKIIVKDTGTGIPPELVERLFEPFFTTKDQGEGTGMGLSVVHGIVKSLKGEVIVHSSLGKGSRFDVLLPVVKVFDEIESLPETAIEKGSGHILLVDDEPALIEVGKLLLSKLGFTITARTSGIEALKVFKKQPEKFDLVLTDLTMPQMTGDRLAKEIFSIRKEIPIILCTGFSTEITEKTARDIGIKGFLMKPMVKSELIKVINQVILKK